MTPDCMVLESGADWKRQTLAGLCLWPLRSSLQRHSSAQRWGRHTIGIPAGCELACKQNLIALKPSVFSEPIVSVKSARPKMSLPVAAVAREHFKPRHLLLCFSGGAVQHIRSNVQQSAAFFDRKPSHGHHLKWPSHNGDAELEHVEPVLLERRTTRCAESCSSMSGSQYCTVQHDAAVSCVGFPCGQRYATNDHSRVRSQLKPS